VFDRVECGYVGASPKSAPDAHRDIVTISIYMDSLAGRGKLTGLFVPTHSWFKFRFGMRWRGYDAVYACVHALFCWVCLPNTAPLHFLHANNVATTFYVALMSLPRLPCTSAGASGAWAYTSDIEGEAAPQPF
jgi:hypothetical protein